jgi:hypothetical protein
MTLSWPVDFCSARSFYATAGIRHRLTSLLTVTLPGAAWMIACCGSWFLARNRELSQ